MSVRVSNFLRLKIDAANVFTSPNGKGLKSVGVMTFADNQLIEINVFVNPKDAPDSGKIAITQKACPARKG